MNVLALILPALIAALLSFALAPLARRVAVLVGAIDQPGERKVHTQPVPRLGGLAIIGSLIAVLSVVDLAGIKQLYALPAEFSIGLFAGLVPILLVSILDDITPLGAKVKFLAHFTGAAIAVSFGVRLNPGIHIFGDAIHIGWVAIPLSILWIAGVTNAFNIVDGLDGLAAGLALISAISLGAVSIVTGNYGTATAALVLAGAIVGFLPFNFHPAKMFMGDTGSAAIGFFLGCLALRGGSTTSAGLAILLPLVVLGLPLAETLVSMARRFMRNLESGDGKGMFAADRGHFHHRLLDLGLKHHHAVLLLYGVGLLLAAAGLISVFLTVQYAAILLVTLLVAAFIGIGRLGYDEFAIVRRGIALKVYETPIFRSTIFVVFADLALLVLAIYGAIVLKYDDWGIQATRMLARDLIVFVPASAVLVFWSFRLYRGAWKLASVEDFVRCSAAVIVASVAGFGLAMAFGSAHVAPTLAFTFTILALMLINGARLSYRVLSSWTERVSHRGAPVLIYGAGVGGVMALRELMSNQEQGMKPVGFIDDDPRKRGRYVQGFRVYGSLEVAPLLASGKANGVIVASEKLERNRVLEMREICHAHGASLSYFLIDFHTVGEFEFSVLSDDSSPRLPIRPRTPSADHRLRAAIEKRAASKEV